METDTLLAYMVGELHLLAESILNSPVIDYQTLLDRPHRTTKEALAGKYVLDIASLTGAKLLTLSSAYRLTTDRMMKERYRNRIIREIHAVSSLPDWNPGHFLDVGELSLGMAITYDWLYNELREEDRIMIETSLLENAIKPGIAAYKTGARWTNTFNNWTQVVNGGLVISALAIGDQYPVICEQLLENVRSVMPAAMESIYAPDVVYHEGPSYWQYGTTFNLLLINALQTSLETDWGLLATPGLDKTGVFQMHCISPTYRYFNYADAPEEARLAPAFFFLSESFSEPAFTYFIRIWLRDILYETDRKKPEPAFTLSGSLSGRKTCRFFPLSVIWYVDEDTTLQSLPSQIVFSDQGSAMLRSHWYDEKASYIGFKGGANGVSHSHLDIGSFVLDGQGVRWAVDLGREVYDLEGMFDYSENGKRWTYYRLGTMSHNTLIINDKNQSVHAKAHIIGSDFSNNGSTVSMDVSEAYRNQASQVIREITMTGQTKLFITDTIMGLTAGDAVRWGMLTRAAVNLMGSSAILEQDGKRLHVYILQPEYADFQTLSAQPDDGLQKQNPGVRMLAVNVKARQEEMVIRILFSTGITDFKP